MAVAMVLVAPVEAGPADTPRLRLLIDGPRRTTAASATAIEIRWRRSTFCK